MNEVRKDSAM